MRIISKFHDYYDSVQAQGFDKSVVYVRDEKDLLIKDSFPVQNRTSSDFSVHTEYLGFCGQIYKLFVVKNSKQGFHKIYYDYEVFKEESLRMGATNEWDFGIRRWWRNTYSEFSDFDVTPIIELFHEHQVPIFSVSPSSERHRNTLTLNPRLKDYRFETVKDTFTTYQDIYQYISGVLNSPENKMVKLADKDKIHKHGFDKWSFRKHPDQKKKDKK